MMGNLSYYFQDPVSFHLRYNPLYHDPDLLAHHLDAIDKALDAVKEMSRDMSRVQRFIEVYDTEMSKYYVDRKGV